MSNFFVKLIKNPFVINLLLVIVVSCGVRSGRERNEARGRRRVFRE